MNHESCPFCRIMRGQAKGEIVHRDEAVVALRDARPAAPTHILIIPVKHVASLHAVEAADGRLLGRMVMVAREVAQKEGVDARGYRLVVNTGPDAGQSVFHLHMHLLAGRRMHWPPG